MRALEARRCVPDGLLQTRAPPRRALLPFAAFCGIIAVTAGEPMRLRDRCAGQPFEPDLGNASVGTR